MDIRYGTKFFLGANSPEGFCSLFGDFADSENGDFLWIVKGGPGCGKSEFMKKIGAAAERAGQPVEYILCSLDPSSLDGIYMPELRVGYVDGTAPHVLEPYQAGAASMTLDLGAYYDVAALRTRLTELRALEAHCDEKMGRMRSLIAAAGHIGSCGLCEWQGDESGQAAKRRAIGAARREFGKSASKKRGLVKKRFLSALTPDGTIFLDGTVQALCGRVYTLDNDLGLAPIYLMQIEREALERGHSVILCPDPMAPEDAEAVLIPALELGFVTISSKRKFTGEAYRHVRLDALPSPETAREARRRCRAEARLGGEILRLVGEEMRDVKALHDEIEALYNPYVDFKAIDVLTEKHKKMLFGS